ncbi:MAG: leucine-rich repeat protein [Clostridia bacterium]|nr:leucine-rich repeat protein [Clostridia bacterium]
MKTSKTICCAALSLSLLLSSAGAGFAAGSPSDPAERNFIYVNPLYEDAIDTAALRGRMADAGTFGTIEQLERFTTVEEAGLYLREQMKARAETISFRFVGNVSEDLPVDEILAKALEHTGAPDEGDYLSYQYGAFNMSATYSSNGTTVTYTPTFTFEYYSTPEQEEMVTQELAQVMPSLKLEGKSEYGKIRAIYDFIAQNTTYDNEHLQDEEYLLKYTAYAALFHHTAVCQGYANLLYRMLLTAGIDCRIVSGVAANNYGEIDAHAWNIVKLGDVYYNVDVTWDSGRSMYRFLLKSDQSFMDHMREEAHGIDFTSEEFYAAYPMADADYESLHWTLENGVLTIFGEGDIPADFVRILGEDSGLVERIKVESGIFGIGNRAFLGMTALQSVDLPDTVSRIGMQAFYNCTALSDIHLPLRMDAIEAAAFANCSSLAEIVIPEGITSLTDNMLFSCSSLSRVTLPSTLTSIGYGVFNGCWLPTGKTCIRDVYYAGTEAEWNAVAIGEYNDELIQPSVAFHYLKDGDGKAKVVDASRAGAPEEDTVSATVYAGRTDTVVLIASYDASGRFTGLDAVPLNGGEIVEIARSVDSAETAAFFAVDAATSAPQCGANLLDPLASGTH